MRYISSKNAAEILGINISTLKRWTESGIIKCIKTAGGHRKFTIQNIRDYHKNNRETKTSSKLGLINSQHKKIYQYINKNKFGKLKQILADASLDSDDLTVSTIVNGSYMKGVSVETICDEIIDPSSMIVENALRQNYISHVEAFVSRKLITSVVEGLNSSKPNGAYNGNTALCINFEDNLPDLGVVMSEIILRHNGYNVLNTGSHAKLGDLTKIINKKSINLIVFYLCDMQCCLATFKENLIKTESQIEKIISFAKDNKTDVLFGGAGLEFLPSVQKNINKTFITYSELKSLIV